jgi:DNA polymerase-1
MKTLLLVDGSSYLYRAFHALPDLRNPQGEPTGAIYGVLNMLRRLHKEYPSDYSACVFDAKGPTFRDKQYAEYKANRAPMPDDLSVQVEPLIETVRAMGWPVLMVPGVEADDVIATLTHEAMAQGGRTIISTGDKDLSQLVGPLTTVINTMSNEKLDEAGVEKKFGVKPAQFLDYLTLVGDAVDNVPGVEKVGPKTAVKWITQYGSLEGVLANADKITGVVGDNLRKVVDWLPKARELLTVKADVPLPKKLTELHPQPLDTAALASLFRRFGFRTWLREVEETGGATLGGAPSMPEPPPPAARHGDFKPVTTRAYEAVLTEPALDAWLARIEAAELVSFDTETTSLEPMQAQIVGFSLAVEPGTAAYVPLAHRYAGAPDQLDLNAVLARIKPWLENPQRAKLGQNLKYDMHVLANHGIRLAGVAHDTLLESYVLESHKPHDMDSLAERHLGMKTISYTEVAGKGANQIGFDQVPVERASEYAAEDADVTLQLHKTLYPEVAGDAKLEHVYRDIELPVMQVLFEMERHGVLIDSVELARQSEALGKQIAEAERKAHEAAGQPFNIGSPKQIGEILFVKQCIKSVKKTPSGAPSTDEDALEQLALDHPLPKLILEYRGLAKLKSTYTDKLPKMVNARTGRVHTSYGQATAVTGRLASTDPNLQNIPVRTTEGRRIREAFIAPPGHVIVSADYSQIELRIMAHISQDAGLLAAFRAGEDVHRATAAEIFGAELAAVTSEQRRYAKVINFGLIYGMSAFGLAGQLGIERSAAQQYMERYFARYPGVAEYMQRTRELAREQGYVETVFGRRLWLSDIRAGGGPRRQAAERAAINAPMQGTAADLIKMAMIAVSGWLASNKLESKIVMQVHDELVFEVPAGELETVKREVPKLMCGVAELAVPLVVDVGAGPNWEQAH